MGTVVDGNYYSKYSGDQIDFLLAKNRNWIRNGYFVGGGTAGKFPINQRGNPSYGAGGTIDGWNLDAGHSLTVSNEYIRITSTLGSSGGLTQVIENGELLAGAKVTFSIIGFNFAAGVYADGILIGGISTYGGGSVQKDGSSTTFNVPNGVTTISVTIESGYIWAIKLEYGSANTLYYSSAFDVVAPNYDEELARCQRYLAPVKTSDLIHGISISNTYYFDIPTHQQMASNPVLTDALRLVLVANGGTEEVTIPAGTSGTIGGSGISMTAAISTTGNLQTAVAQVQEPTFLSCE